jgi:tRNA 2-thiouridine synthesizing protein C
MTCKRLLFVNRRTPRAGALAAEMLDAALIAASLGQEVHLAFLDDGVFQLLKGPAAADGGDLTARFAELGDYDIDHVWVERDSLTERGLTAADLAVPVALVDRDALSATMAAMDMVISA